MSSRPVRPPTTPHPTAGPVSQKNLLALGSAAVLTVYATGFLRTKAAAQLLEDGSNARRRPASPSAPSTAPQSPGNATRPVASGVAQSTSQAAQPAVALPSRSVDDSARYTVVLKKGVAQVVAATPLVGDSATLPAPAVSATAASAKEVATPALVAAATTAPPVSVPEPAPVTPAPTAPSPTPPPTPATEAPKPVGWRDGTYTGWGTSRHGDIEATVVIEGGKITGAIISRCLTRYSCSWVAHLQQQVVARQSPEVDNVSGATQSANAFFYAVSEALAKAK